MKTKRNNKRGISLIVLVITIIVMIILAAAVILSLSSNGIIGRANEAVEDMNLAQAQVIANTIWADGYLDGEDEATIKDKIIAAIGANNAAKYDIEVTPNGATVELKGSPYGDESIVPTKAEYFTYDYDDTTMTATLTGVHEDYAQKSYYDSTAYTSAIIADDGTVITDVVIPYETIDENGDTYIVTAIGDYAFGKFDDSYDFDYTSFVLPNTIISIGDYAFANCDGLTSITIPNSVTSIGECAFRNACLSLTDVYYLGNVGDWLNINFVSSESTPCCCGANLYFDNILVEELVIPEGITSIGGNAFDNCSSLTNITIPESVTSIGGGAFKNCRSLTSITIPESVTSIGGYAFDNCDSLTNVYYKGSETDWAAITIDDFNYELTSANITYNYTGEESSQ